MTNMATNMITFVLVNPLNASAGVLIPVRTSARIIPEEMTEKGTLPVANAIIVINRIINVICIDVIFVSLYLYSNKEL